MGKLTEVKGSLQELRRRSCASPIRELGGALGIHTMAINRIGSEVVVEALLDLLSNNQSETISPTQARQASKIMFG